MAEQPKKRSKHAEELEWLFKTCESEMGVKSNFPAIIVACKVGSKRARVDKDTGSLTNGVVEDLDNEDRVIDALDKRRSLSRLAATAKNRRVMRSYKMVHVMHQRVLEAAYEARQYPPELRVFGDAAGVAALTPTARGLAKWSWAWLGAAIARKDPKATAIRREAERMLDGAHAAYERARDAVASEPMEVAA